jgi:hypothetical protein
MGVVDKTATLNSNDESIFIIGVAPESYRILIFPGEVIDGKFKQNQWRGATVYGAADKGFLVGKAAAGETLAILIVQAAEKKGALTTNNFKACSAKKTITFKIPSGKVIYLGNLAYQLDGDLLRVHYHQDLASAQKYMDDNYPSVHGKVEQSDFDILPTIASCAKGSTVPMYITLPRRR